MADPVTAAEISVESDGVRLSLRVESSLQRYARTHEARSGGVEPREFDNLLPGCLTQSLPSLLQARDAVLANLSVAYTDLLSKACPITPGAASQS